MQQDLSENNLRVYCPNQINEYATRNEQMEDDDASMGNRSDRYHSGLSELEIDNNGNYVDDNDDNTILPDRIIINDEVVVSYINEILSIQPLAHLQKIGLDLSKAGKFDIPSKATYMEIISLLARGQIKYSELYTVSKLDHLLPIY